MALRARPKRSGASHPEPDPPPGNRVRARRRTRGRTRGHVQGHVQPAPEAAPEPAPDTAAENPTWAFTERHTWGRGERRRLPDLRVAALTPPVIAIRWGALAVGFALASADVADGDTRIIAFGAVILAYAVFRTLRPIRYEEGPGTVWGVLAELALCVFVVCGTGYWESPFVFSLMTAVIAAGFARGFTFAINAALGSAAAQSPSRTSSAPARRKTRSDGRRSGRSSCSSSRWSRGMPGASSRSPSASSRWPSTASAA